MRKTKLLFVNNNMHVGGVQRSLSNLLRSIDKNRYDVTLFLFNYSGHYLADLPDDIRVISASFPLNTLGMSMIEARKIGPWHVIAKSFFAIVAKILGTHRAILLAQMFQRKLDGFDVAISYLHPATPRRFYGGTNEFVVNKTDSPKKVAFIHADFSNYGGDKKYSAKLYKPFNKIAVCSQGCRDAFLEILPEFRDKTVVIYNLHNIEAVLARSKRKLIDFDANQFNLVSPSRVTFEKGIDKIILAVSEYIKKYDNNILLHVLGDGKDVGELQTLVESLDIADKVRFYGNVDPYPYIAHSQLTVLLSRHEAAPMIFGESIMLGVPILSTPTSSVRELVVDRNAGWVCSDDAIVVADTLRSIRTGDLYLEGYSKAKNIKNQELMNATALNNFYEAINDAVS